MKKEIDLIIITIELVQQIQYSTVCIMEPWDLEILYGSIYDSIRYIYKQISFASGTDTVNRITSRDKLWIEILIIGLT